MMSAILEEVRLLSKRKNYLVDPELQFRIARQSLAVLAAGLVLAVGNVYVLATLRQALDASPAAAASWPQLAMFVTYGLVFASVSVGVVAILAVVYAHRIAGPVLKIRATLRRLANDELPDMISLRRHDMLTDIAEGVNAVTAQHVRMRKEVREALREARAADDPAVRRMALERIERVAGLGPRLG